MKIQQLNDGSIEIQTNEISYTALIRCIQKIPEAKITYTTYDPMTDNTVIEFKYKDINVTVETPFSDYIITCNSDSPIFGDLIDILRKHNLKWWEYFF